MAAQMTPAPHPLAALAIRDGELDLTSLLSAGLSLVSSILTPATTASADDPPPSKPTTTLATSVNLSTNTDRTTSAATSGPMGSPSSQPSVSSTGLPSTTGSPSKSSPSSSSTASNSLSQLKPLSTSSTTASAASSTTTPTLSTHSGSKLPIILGVVLGLVILALLVIVLLLWHRRRQNRDESSNRGSGFFLFSPRRSRTATPVSDGESEIMPTAPFMAKDEDVALRYPSIQPIVPCHPLSSPPPQVSSFQMPRRHPSNGYAFVPARDPFDDTNRYFDGPAGGTNGFVGVGGGGGGSHRRTSRRRSSSSILDTVAEHPEQQQASLSDPGLGGSSSPPPPLSPLSRRWSNGSNGGFVPPVGMPPTRSSQRRNIPRKPIASQGRVRSPGFEAGMAGQDQWFPRDRRLVHERSW